MQHVDKDADSEFGSLLSIQWYLHRNTVSKQEVMKFN